MSDEAQVKQEKCPPCPPGAPMWMSTFSDLVTLLLTFFVLLLSFAKTETSKYEAAMGSIRNAFGGNVLVKGKVVQLGKSPDDSPSMLDSETPIKPFPIDFLTMEGLLDKHEINRESSEDLMRMRDDLMAYDLAQSVDVYEMPEGIKVRVKDKIYFKGGSTELSDISIEVFDRMVKLLTKTNWTVFVEGHSSKGEEGGVGMDAFALSSKRAAVVSRVLIKKGVLPSKVTTVFYGDTRPDEAYEHARESNDKQNSRVEFIIRKTDLRSRGHKVESTR